MRPKATFIFSIFITLVLTFVAALFFTEYFIGVIERFQQYPLSNILLFSLTFFVLFTSIMWAVLKFIFPSKSSINTVPIVSDEKNIRERIKGLEKNGTPINDLEDELNQLNQNDSEKIKIAIFGEINMGKSSLIASLIPSNKTTIEVIGGSTQNIMRYTWQFDQQNQLILEDMPGTQHSQIGDYQFILDAVTKSHIVVYVCDGDLNQNQYNEIEMLLNKNKPIVIAINKIDLYTDEDLDKIENKIKSYFVDKKNLFVTKIQVSGKEKLVAIDQEGNEKIIEKNLPSRTESLKNRLQDILTNSTIELHELRNRAVLSLLSEKLDVVEQEVKQQQAKVVVQQYTNKAVVGALATVSPGTDIIVQTYFGTSMVKEISSIFDVRVSDYDIKRLLTLVQNQVGTKTPIILAVVGNALKAFPGIGTIAGGLVHAVAYGLIFRTLGNCLIKSLSENKMLKSAYTASTFQEMLNENMENSTMDIIKIALKEKNKSRSKAKVETTE